jgi:hypothetical protein
MPDNAAISIAITLNNGRLSTHSQKYSTGGVHSSVISVLRCSTGFVRTKYQSPVTFIKKNKIKSTYVLLQHHSVAHLPYAMHRA